MGWFIVLPVLAFLVVFVAAFLYVIYEPPIETHDCFCDQEQPDGCNRCKRYKGHSW